MEYFDRGGRRAVWVVHRRGGKDLTAMHQTCKMAHLRRGAYWHVYPSFPQARKAIWEGFTDKGDRILDLVFPKEIIKRRNEQEMFIELKCGSIWRLLGSDKIEVVGAGAVGVVYSEYALAKPMAAELISPMLMQNGGWESYITTPRGNNHAKKIYDHAKADKSWFCELLTLYDTNAESYGRPPDQIVAEERARGKPEALIRQEYLCDWTAANVGSVWGDLIEALERSGRVAEFATEKDGVYTSWDLGHTDSTAIWFWRLNGERAPDLIDHYEAFGKPMSHYFDLVESKPYKYVKHWLPHDARAKTLQTGSSIIEQTAARWDNVEIAPQLSIADGIQAARWMLQQPMRIHSRCVDGIQALKHYRYHYDEDSKTFSVKPEHDWASHTADAFRYLACVMRHTESMTRPPTPKKAVEMSTPVLGRITMDELWSIRDSDVRGRS